MEHIETIKYIYQTNVLIEVILLASLLLAILKPKLLMTISTAVLLLRPNERMDIQISFMHALIPILFIVIIVHIDKVKIVKYNIYSKYLNWFIVLVLVETLIFNVNTFIEVSVFIAVGYLFFFAIIIFMADKDGIKLLSKTVVFCCFIICFEPLYYHFSEVDGSDLWNLFHLPKSGRLQAWGMWANANETAFIACIGVANTAYIAVKYRNIRNYVVMLLLLPFFGLTIFLTASRAGFASLLLIFLPSVILANSKLVKIGAVVIILVATGLSHFWTPERTDAEGSSNDRYELRRRGKLIIEEHPFFGVGFLNARYEAGSRPLHNTYLQAFAETGISGGCLLLFFLLKLGQGLHLAFKVNMKNGTESYLIYMIGLYYSSLFYFLWGNQLLSILFFLVTAQIICSILSSETITTYNTAIKCDSS